MASDTTIDGVRIDQTTRAVSGINSEHHEIHANRSYWANVINSDTAASGTLTLAANAANAETVTIDTKVYTWLDAVGVADGNVHIGATAAESLDNLVAAMGLKAGAGVAYGVGMTAHTTCTGERVGDTLVVTANALGTAGNAYPSTETMAQGSWGAVTLTGGLAADRKLIAVLKTPNTTMRLHIVADWISESRGTFEIYEGRTWTTSTGSQASVYNRRRESTATTTVLEDTTGTFADNNAIVKNPATLAAGTLIHKEQSWMNLGKSEINATHTRNEIVLKPNSTYSFELTSNNGLKASYIILRWYEKVDGS